VQFDLSEYVGKKIRIRFYLADTNSTEYDVAGWFVDDVSIQERPADVTLNVPTNATKHSLGISWTENTDDDFKEYRLYRATTSDVILMTTWTAARPTTTKYMSLPNPVSGARAATSFRAPRCWRSRPCRRRRF
jgi:hypothetical protein